MLTHFIRLCKDNTFITLTSAIAFAYALIHIIRLFAGMLTGLFIFLVNKLLSTTPESAVTFSATTYFNTPIFMFMQELIFFCLVIVAISLLIKFQSRCKKTSE